MVLRDQSTRRSFFPVLIAISAGLTVFAISYFVFPYHSSNHDEGVYLIQTAMLLNGQLELHAGPLADAFHPWFFIQDDGGLYPKYSPVPAGFYALSTLVFGTPRVALAVVAAGNTYLIYLLGSMAFTRRIGTLAALVFAVSPLALITSAVYLPYAPTTFLNLLFAVGYLRGIKNKSVAAALGAGGAIGLAFFARPFTAVVFAVPFTIHATLRLILYYRNSPTSLFHRHLLTAIVGILFVIVTLWYNHRLTGSLFVFPYEAFAPRDGPGFGQRRILSHTVNYTPILALEANSYVVWYFATRWFAAGPLGTLLAISGLFYTAASLYPNHPRPPTRLRTNSRVGRHASILLMAVFPSVILGNFLFWGNFNLLGTMTNPADGLLSRFGPFYHFDLLIPLSIFTAVSLSLGWDYVTNTPPLTTPFPTTTQPRRAIVYGSIAIILLIAGITTGVLLATPLDRNYTTTLHYENAYDPIEQSSLQHALVFIPTPYGEWQHHPFQYLRNSPDFDSETVYALNRGPANFQVTDTYPTRSYHRYTYRGEWSRTPNQPISPLLEPLSVQSAPTHRGETHIDIPPGVTHAGIRLDSSTGHPAQTYQSDLDNRLTIPWAITPDNAQASAMNSSITVPINTTDTLALSIILVQQDGSIKTYRQELSVRTNQTHVDVIWPPDRYECSLVIDCGNEGRYLPTTASDPDSESFHTELLSSSSP